MAEQNCQQTLFVVRHGERMDFANPHWVDDAPRPYDPPLTKKGEKQAKKVAKDLKGKDIKYVIVSPFLRCFKTGQYICDALGLEGMHTSNEVVDVFNRTSHIYQQPEVPLRLEEYTSQGFKVLSLDDSPVPRFPETNEAGLKRIENGFNHLADKYYPSNIVVVAHGYCVNQAVDMTEPRGRMAWSDYCGCVQMKRTRKGSYSWQLVNHNAEVHIHD